MPATPRRSTPTPAELQVWRGFIETAELLRTRIERQLQSASSLSTGDYRVLLALSEADEHTLRSSRLAEIVEWERSRLSHHLRRMEARGLVERSSCRADGHGVEVRMSDAGQAAFRASTVPHLQAVRELFVDALTPEQLAQAADVTAALQEHLRAAAAE